MNPTFPRWCGLFLAALLAWAIYAPTLNADPLWDDNYFIFWRYFFQPLPTLSVIWKNHFWPMFDSLVVMLYSWWKAEATYWRWFNLSLHFANAFLLARLIELWRPRYFWPVLLLFLIHPLNVMSVAFIIQLKTVLCLFFLLCALWCYWWAEKRQQFWPMLVSWLFFFCSIMSKSASITFPLIGLLALACFQLINRRSLLLLLPFSLITLIGVWRFQVDPLLEVKTNSAEQSVLGAEAPPPIPQAAPIPKARPIPKAAPIPKAITILKAMPAQAPIRRELPPPLPPIVMPKWQMLLDNFGSYFRYPVFPWPLALAHGRFEGWTIAGVSGLSIFVIALGVSIYRRQRIWIFLLLGQAIALIPFIGFIFAPYMSYTSVSEQHLYLILPFSLIGILLLLEYFKEETRLTVTALYICALTVLSVNYASTYVNEETLFRRILDERPRDLFAHVNLAGYYQRLGHHSRAQIMVRIAAKLVEENPDLRRDPAYAALVQSWNAYGLE